MTAGALTTLEATFLELEHPGMPMHVAGISVLEGGEPITLEALHRALAGRIRRLPKLRQRVAIDLTHRRWISEPRVDIGAHLYRHRLHPQSTERALFALCARIHETPLSREGPLWEMHLIDGLRDRRQALVIKTHHAITDGLAAMEMGGALFDPEPGAARMVAIPAPRLGTGSARRALTTVEGLMGLAYAAAGGPLARPGPFNGRVGPRRSFAGVVLPMTAILALKRELGVSVDDVLLALVAVGLRHYLMAVAYPEMPHALRAMIPVSTRMPSRAPVMGNHVTSIFIDLPLDSDDVAAVAARVSRRKSDLRSMHAAAGAAMLVEAVGLLPPPVHAIALDVAAHLPFAHLVLSDVPGPFEAQYLLGRRVVASYPMMPLAPALGLSIAAISMGGGMAIGVTADPCIVPGTDRIARSIASALTV